MGGGRGPSSREYDSPRSQNSSWSRAQGPAWDGALRVGSAGRGYLYLLPPLLVPPPDVLLHSLTLDPHPRPRPLICGHWSLE